MILAIIVGLLVGYATHDSGLGFIVFLVLLICD
jgi:hypothetical protein